MNDANVRLSPKEEALVKDAEWILTKNGIISKAGSLLDRIATAATPLLKVSDLPAEVRATHPKISKGENYKGLPYLVLDYPRLFLRDHVFAIRTLFWWAHYFTVTLHLKGNYKTQYAGKLADARDLLAGLGFFICLAPDEWQHAVDAEYYLPLANCNTAEMQDIFSRHSFGKVVVKISLDNWNQTEKMVLDYYRALLQILS